MPKPAKPSVTPYTDQLPDVNNPATWADRTPLFYNWVTGPGYTNMDVTVTYADDVATYIDTALSGDTSTLIDSLATHIADVANPHDVTIEQVGGQPTGSPMFGGSVSVSLASSDFKAFQAFNTATLNTLRKNRVLFHQAYKADGVTPRPLGGLVTRVNSGGTADPGIVGIEYYNPGTDALVEAMNWNASQKVVFPEGDIIWDLGSLASRFKNIHTRQLFAGPDCFFNATVKTGGGTGPTIVGSPGASGSVLEITATGNANANRDFIRFYSTSAEAGSIEYTGAATVSYLTSSDYRLKENETAIEDAIERLMNLRPYRLNFKDEPHKTIDSFFAHEVAEVVPEAVSGEKDAMQDAGTLTDADGVVLGENVAEPDKLAEGQSWAKTGEIMKIQTMENQKLVPLLTAALQEAVSKIEVLTARLDALEGKVS